MSILSLCPALLPLCIVLTPSKLLEENVAVATIYTVFKDTVSKKEIKNIICIYIFIVSLSIVLVVLLRLLCAKLVVLLSLFRV